jgi:hypothetical protein
MKSGFISVYMHQLNFKNATLDGGDIWRDYLNAPLSKYDTEMIIGIKYGFTFF